MRRLTLALVAAALLAAPAAAENGSPDRYKVGWNETLKARGEVAMTFTVTNVHFQFSAWAAQVEFHNRSPKSIVVKPQFGLLLSKTRDEDKDYEVLLARRSEPALPKTLLPGQRWKGVISGPGRPRRNAYVRVNFGFFAVSGLFADRSKGFSWITDHVFQVAEKA